MIKLVYVIRKRADVSDEHFHKYWLEKHGPLVRGFAKAMRAKKYVQSHTIAEDAGRNFWATRPQETETYDGITEVWWDSLDDIGGDPQNAQRLEAGRALLQDESTFIDFEKSSIFLTQEHEIFDYTK